MGKDISQSFSVESIISRFSNFFKSISQSFSIDSVVKRVVGFFRSIITFISMLLRLEVVRTPPPYIGLELLYPDGNVNVTQNRYFYVQVNVSCYGINCGAINVSLDPITKGICYQEFANVSTDCGGLDTGGYSCENTWNSSEPCSNTYDGDWETYGATTYPSSGGTLYTNYTIPTRALNTSVLQISWDKQTIENLTGVSECLDNEDGILQIRAFSLTQGPEDASRSAWYCWDSTGSPYWKTLKGFENGLGNHHIYEEGMFWNLSENKEGLVSTIEGDYPFYTNNSNPREISLNQGESQIITFWVNATGRIGLVNEFYVYANQTQKYFFDRFLSNETTHWNVTIVEFQQHLRDLGVSLSPNSIIERIINLRRTIPQILNIEEIVSRLANLFKKISQLFSIESIVKRTESFFKEIGESFSIEGIVSRFKGMGRVISQALNTNISRGCVFLYKNNSTIPQPK